ncbi:MAG: stage 0 sporulation protein [Chloroflexi bacterium HGW-Chloroflexi-1]|nr:MAG: stage 0 sporulation protein [Chloroflexi bacterium HGW-Chloroflexi-1]
MPIIVGVAFKPVTKVYYFDPAGIEDLQAGEQVIVETARGRTMGEVVLAPRDVPDSEIRGVLKPVVRRATAWDMVQSDQMAHKEAETLTICREKAAALRLDMKVVKAEYTFDGSSVVVYFTAEQRIDFRNLVHELAQTLHTRVEMRQVGVRDEAKFLGGLGRCGRQFCCASWLREFTPVSIKMAKQQDLPLNTSEVSGVCGRLLCCLSYENDFYVEARRHMPRINSTLVTPEGPGKVKQIHVLRNSVTVRVDGPNDTTQYIEVPLEPTPEELPLATTASKPAPTPAPAPARTTERPARQPARARAERRTGAPDSDKGGEKEAERVQDQASRASHQRRPRRRRR